MLQSRTFQAFHILGCARAFEAATQDGRCARLLRKMASAFYANRAITQIGVLGFLRIRGCVHPPAFTKSSFLRKSGSLFSLLFQCRVDTAFLHLFPSLLTSLWLRECSLPFTPAPRVAEHTGMLLASHTWPGGKMAPRVAYLAWRQDGSSRRAFLILEMLNFLRPALQLCRFCRFASQQWPARISKIFLTA